MVFVVNFGFGQTKIAELTFEGVPSDLAYTTNYSNGTLFTEFSNGNLNYFTRTDGSNIGPSVVLTNQQGSFYFGAQNIDDDPDVVGQIPLFLNIDDINISGYTDLEFRVHLAEDDEGTNEDWDNYVLSNDFVHFNYDIDNTGSYYNLLWIESGVNYCFLGCSDAAPLIDTDFNGNGDGTEITNTFRQFTQPIPLTGNLLDIQIEFSLNLSQEDIAIDNIEIWGTPIGGCTTNTTWDGTNWDNGVPNTNTNAILNADYSTLTNGGGFEACNLTVNSGILRILDTEYVKVENDILVDGTIIIASEASLVQVSDSGIVLVGGMGDCILQKSTTYIDDWFDYTYWSSPVSNESIGSVFAGVPADRVYKYNASNFDDFNNDTFDDDGNDWINAGQTEILTPGKGYAAVANAIGMLGVQTFTFNGIFNNGIITPNVTVSAGANPQHWNFLGNPYPSAIDANLFLGDASNSSIIDGTIYFWTHNSDPDGIYDGINVLNFTSDDYASYNLTGGVGTQAASSDASNNFTVPTGLIASGQGFFVEGLTAGMVTFNNSMRVTSGNDNFYRFNQTSPVENATTDRLWLNLQNEHGAFSQILIGFNEIATNGVDRLFDGKRLSANSFVSFYSLIEDEKYAIQGLAPFSEDVIIPIGIHVNVVEELPYSISIDNVEGVLMSSNIVIRDKLLNIDHNLTDSEYIFNSEVGEFNDRFEIRFSNSLSIINFEETVNELIVNRKEQNYLEIFTTNQSIIKNVNIFDILGRQLLDLNYDKPSVTINLNTVGNSIIMVKVTLSDGEILTKKVLL